MRTSNHKRIVIPLLVITLGMIAVHLILQFRAYALGQPSMLVLGPLDVDLAYWFNLNVEKHFGALFSTSLILFASLLMCIAAFRAKSKKLMMIGWFMIAGILLFMACDEFFSIHERAGAMAGIESQGYGTQVLPSWVRVMAVVVGLLCIPMGFFWWMLPRGLRIRTVISAGVFLGGAMGVEIISSAFVMQQGTENFGFYVLVAIEEGMEMFGILILIDAMLLHLLPATAKAAASEEVEAPIEHNAFTVSS